MVTGHFNDAHPVWSSISPLSHFFSTQVIMSFFKKLNHADKFIPVKVDLTGYYRETSQHIHMHTKSTQYVQKKKKKWKYVTQ